MIPSAKSSTIEAARSHGSPRARLVRGLCVIVVAWAAWACGGAVREGAPPRSAQDGSLDRGKVIYRRFCISCHGIDGDGRGPAAAQLELPPRDLTRGVYRYRSTPSGSLPLDSDLMRSVLEGMPGTPMPAFRDLLSAQEAWDVVAWVRHYSPRFEKEAPEEPIEVPAPLPYSPESVGRGRAVYERLQCGKCHGQSGRGDGWAKADEMKDDEGRVVRARDFTRGIYRSGNTRQDLWRAMVTGLDGTPMPSYEGSAAPEELSDLVNYLVSLERKRGVWYWLTTPPRWHEPGQHKVDR